MPRPRLLISVRNASEAADALAAGADLIDVKEPNHGALGMADAATIHAVLSAVQSRVPTSIALGELADSQLVPQLPLPPTYAKYGLAGARRMHDWPAKLGRMIGRLPREVQAVAVAYADWQMADAPSPQTVLEVAADLGCRGLLLDTFLKSNGSLLTHLGTGQLAELIDRARSMKLITVLAGGLKLADMAQCVKLEPDYFGFRGAVCRGAREATLHPQLVRALKLLLQEETRSDQESLVRNSPLPTG